MISNPEKSFESEQVNHNIPESLKGEWQDIPKDFVRVYHFTRPEVLREIAEKGLRHYTEIIPEEELSYYQKIKVYLDQIFDQVAEELDIGFKRSNSVFASPKIISEKEGMGKGNVLLEIAADPKKVFVSDGRLVTAAGVNWLKTPEGKNFLREHPDFIEEKDREIIERLQNEFSNDYLEYVRRYWQKAKTLEEWNNLSEKEKVEDFTWPEVIINDGIDPKFIRVKEK